MFLVWFFLRPISPKEDTTLHLKPIVEAREHVYFLYICIHTLTSRSQLPPFLSWFDYLNIFMYSPRILTNPDIQRAGGWHQNIGHVSPRTCSLPISPSASISWFMSLSKATPVVQWPPLPTHVKTVLNFGIQVPF